MLKVCKKLYTKPVKSIFLRNVSHIVEVPSLAQVVSKSLEQDSVKNLNLLFASAGHGGGGIGQKRDPFSKAFLSQNTHVWCVGYLFGRNRFSVFDSDADHRNIYFI